ncbi:MULTISPECIES: hypothetical protein [Shewanella]|uniref:Uncharacterized protein n=1 Tax=Shewanella putrefaciens (strain 200) TaxID=399804 RepID=E6XQ28_SHEP2|nr:MULTISPECIES: hypothetical protein [Shewanella]CAD6364658.1 hypothetical protein SHEWT2_02460 [Shewanella hafniensis]SUI75125.1 Uncharacterised protein [Shewanella putrefaciens]
MKLALSQFIAERLNLMIRFTNFSMTNLILFFGVLFVLPIVDLLSVLIGGYVDIGELLVFSDSFLAEFIGASLLGLLLLHPLVILQLWHLIDSCFKFFNHFDLTNTSRLLAPPRLKSLEHTAHGCRAPPF